MVSLGKDPDKSVKLPDNEFGFGDEAYLGGMDIFHQLHCFDSIRKEAFKDYYWDEKGGRYHMEGYGPETGKPKKRHTEIFVSLPVRPLLPWYFTVPLYQGVS